MNTVQDSTVLITGANRGIGKAYAEAFLNAGAKKIYVCTRDLENVADFVATDPERLIPLKLDVTNKDDIKAAAAAAQDVDILINNAGVLDFDDFASTDMEEKARFQMEVNYFAVIAVTQAFAPILKANGGGLIATVSSIVGHVTMPGFAGYCASKYAVQSLILSMRLSFAAQGTKVVGVYPGPIETDMTHAFEMDKFQPSQVAEETIKGIENGQEDVFTDAFSQEFYAAFRKDPKAVEAQMLEMAQQQEEAA